MKLIFSKKYVKNYQSLDKKIQQKADNTLVLFVENPLNPLLNNHSLKGKFSDYRSINVTGDYRIRIHPLQEKTYEIVEIIDIWTHSKFYG